MDIEGKLVVSMHAQGRTPQVEGSGGGVQAGLEQEIDDKIQEFCEEDCICITTIQEEADFLPKTINEQEDVPA